jgi:hypothetical protein
MGILAMQVPPSVYVLVRLQDKDVSRHLVAAEASSLVFVDHWVLPDWDGITYNGSSVVNQPG